MAATLHLRRDNSFLIELRRGRFEILVDNEIVGSIESHGVVEVPLEPGRHAIRLRAGRYTSREHSFTVADREVANFRCHGASIWPMYLVSIVKPDLAIAVRRE
jgi:hypothetical protein